MNVLCYRACTWYMVNELCCRHPVLLDARGEQAGGLEEPPVPGPGPPLHLQVGGVDEH